MMQLLSAEGLREFAEKIAKAIPCPKHGREFLMLCVSCGDVACRECRPMFCQCENDE